MADHLTGTQTYRERRPAAELGRHATCVFVQQVFPGSEPYTHRPVPNGSAELRCEVGGMPHVVGPQTGPLEYTLAPGAILVTWGASCRPTCLLTDAFTPMPPA